MPWPQASSDRWCLRKYLVFSCLAVRQNRSWRGLHALRVLSALFAVKPAYRLPSHTHTASSDIKKELVLHQLLAPPCHWLRTIWKSRAAQAFATTIDWRSDGVSNRRSTCKLDRRLSVGHAHEFVFRRVAPSDRPLRAGGRGDRWSGHGVISKLGKFNLQVTMVLWTPFRTRLTKKTLPESKFRPIQACVKFWLYSQASVPRQLWVLLCCVCESAGATFTWFCLRVMRQISMPAKRWHTILQGRIPDPLML